MEGGGHPGCLATVSGGADEEARPAGRGGSGARGSGGRGRNVKHAQVLVCESDGRLAALLREYAERHNWTLREPRQLGACLRLLRRGGPNVFVLKVGRDLEHD